MLESVKIQKRQSEIRQELATLAGKETPDENELRSMTELDTEYAANETRYRAALISEDEQREEAKGELESRSEKEFAELINNFEVRQVADFYQISGFQLSGQTAEIVQELRQQGDFKGVPVPWEALEQRAGETVASATPNPRVTKNLIDRIFPASTAARMGVSMLNVPYGEVEVPVVTAGSTVSWQATETGSVGAATQFTTIDRPMTPANTMGCQMHITRKAQKQSGKSLEQAIRRDMAASIAQELDRVVFLGSGTGGEPTGMLVGSYGYDSNDVSATADYSAFRDAATEFLVRNAASDHKAIRLLMRTELHDQLDDALYSGTSTSEWDRLVAKLGAVIVTTNSLSAPAGSPAESTAVMTVTTGQIAPYYLATWGPLDVIADRYTQASSGALVLTALITADCTASRSEQVGILTGLQ
ncbi:MAG: phage major capsid protein [Halioglobus sp.]